MAKCKNCKILCLVREKDGSRYYWCFRINDNPDVDEERKCKYYEVANNSDMIRKMTDEELAEHIITTPTYETCIKFCKNREECCAIMDMDNDIPEEWCEQCLLEWLQKEVE